MAIHPFPITFTLNTHYRESNDELGMDFDVDIVGDLPGCNGKVLFQRLDDGQHFYGGGLMLAVGETVNSATFKLRMKVMEAELELWRARHERG
jgi:hypothetical protein